MPRFLSSAWFSELAHAGSRQEGSTGDDQPAGLVIQQVVLDTPDGDVRYWVRIREGETEVQPGQTDDPDVTFTEDYATATAIARGDLTTQAALLGGRIRVSGNLAALAAHREGIGDVDPLPEAVRAATSY